MAAEMKRRGFGIYFVGRLAGPADGLDMGSGGKRRASIPGLWASATVRMMAPPTVMQKKKRQGIRGTVRREASPGS